MPDLLLELFSEEIPARMQRRAADDLRRLVTDALVEAGLTYEGAKGFATPRRLALTVNGLPASSPDVAEERKGPRVGAPEQAVAGFLRGAGLASLDEATIQSDPKKGEFYVATIRKPGRPAPAIVAEIVPRIVRAFPWPKAMRWGDGRLTWVRPLHAILCTFGPETEEPEIVPFEIDGIVSGDVTYGHRFMAPVPIRVKRFDDYAPKLEAARVVLDADRRKDIIVHDARDRAFALGLELIEDDALLEEVAGLVEWPVVLTGSFDEAFLEIPPEAIRATIRANQKCFVLRRPAADGAPERLANRFVLVANIEASDGGAAIVAGNERVIRARLADARYFWDTDRAVKLDERAKKLDAIVFHEKLGTQGERVARLRRLAREIAPLVGADPARADRAAELAKADLVTEMVGEFPELQGLMGKYYAAAQGEDPSVAAAIEDHYRPQGPADRVPTDPVAIAVALADKLDMLVGFWAIDEKPTGSKDPYALRRAALGVIRIVLENGLRLGLTSILLKEFDAAPLNVDSASKTFELIDFLSDRLKVVLRESGARHDLVDCVLSDGDDPSKPNQKDLLLIVRRVEALAAFLATEDGANLLIGYRRAANILRAEEKGGERFDGAVEGRHLVEPEEIALAAAVETARADAAQAVADEDFAAAMAALARLRAPVDAFFDEVLVNAPEPDVRSNRLRLLGRIRETTRTVADFSRIEG